jgi:SSS family transporter
MEGFRQEIILSSVFLYMLLCVGVGIWAMRRTKSASDFFVAGRSLGPVVTGLAVFSSTMSGFGFVGGPGLVYATGLSSIWMVTVSAFGFAVAFFLLAKRIRMIAEVRNTLSLPDVIAARYGSEPARFLTAVTILMGVLGYMATQILAMSMVLRTILRSTDLLADISLPACAAISLSVLIFYSVTGGIIASVYTDLVQGLIMIVAGGLVVFTAANIFDGGMAEASTLLLADDAEAIMPFGTVGALGAVAWFFLFSLGLAGQPHIVTKMMMNRRISDNRTILPLSVLGYMMSAALWISVGVVMRALVVGNLHLPLETADSTAPAFLAGFAHPLLAGVVFAGLFAAIMSTADAFLNIGAAAVVHDIPKSLRGCPLRNELFWARVATVLICVLAAAFALYSYYQNERLVGLLGAFGWGTFAAALVPVLVIGLNWKRANRRAAVGAISLSLIMNFSFEVFSVSVPYGMSGGFLSLLVSLLVFIGWSLAEKQAPIPSDIERVMDF